jgi:hypothetical protein
MVEQFSWHCDLCHLEDGVAGVAYYLGPDLHELLAQTGQRPLCDGLGQVKMARIVK